jgi:hypothetical protein
MGGENGPATDFIRNMFEDGRSNGRSIVSAKIK